MKPLQTLLATAAILLLGASMAQEDGVAEDRVVEVGMEAVGTFSWINFAMEHYGIDEELGFDIETTSYATKQAKQLALQSGESDLVVDDITGVALWHEQGLDVKGVYPYSIATGGVVVRADSDIQTIEDLSGATIAATDLGDKTLLILRSLLVGEHGFDPQVDGEIVSAAPPLMSELLARGEIDAAIPPWHFVARMVATGEFREIISAVDMLEQLGASTDLPILMVAARTDMDPQLLSDYIQAMNMTIERMKGDDEIFQLILDEELYSLPDPSVFPQVIERWEAGIPQRWDQEVIDGIVDLIDEMVELAGSEVVGVEGGDAEAFTAEYNP
ncbi:MAG: PhnD/SsuA/transferrin family substrate-binding protein [Trueperaceae bacterium]